MIECPGCHANIDVEEDGLDEGESVLCEDCGKNWVVASTDPVELEPEADYEEDDEFDEEFDEDEDEEEEEDEEDEEDEDWR